MSHWQLYDNNDNNDALHFASRLAQYYTNMNHVPYSWRLDVPSSYFFSPFLYCMAGVVLLVGQATTAEEAAVWVWQGVCAFWSDSYNMGVSSISHPIDRVSSTVVTVYLLRRYLTTTGLLCCHPDYVCGCDHHLLGAEMVFGVWLSLYFFYKSYVSFINKDKDGFIRYHTLWHVGFPSTALLFWMLEKRMVWD